MSPASVSTASVGGLGEWVQPVGKAGSQGSWFYMAVPSPAKLGKGTSDVLPHCAAIQFDQQICAWRRMSAATWGQSAMFWGMYSSKSVSLVDISSPNSFKSSDALFSTPKYVPKIYRFRIHFLHAINKFCCKVMPSGAKRTSTSAKDSAPVLEATMAYWSAWSRSKFLTVDVCCPRTKGWSPVVRLSRLSILNPSASTSFRKEGVAMVGARIPMSSAAVSKALCNTRSCRCFVSRARASQTGGRSFESVTCTRFSRCASFALKYSAAPLFSFLSQTRLLSSRVSLSSTATSSTVLAIPLPAARLMLGSRPGTWLSSSLWRWCRRSASGRGADGLGTITVECVLGPDRTIAARIQLMIGWQAASATASIIALRRRFQASTGERSSLNN